MSLAVTTESAASLLVVTASSMSLLVMIAAFLPEWRQAYQYALDHGYRFLSFGDAMFISTVYRPQAS